MCQARGVICVNCVMFASSTAHSTQLSGNDAYKSGPLPVTGEPWRLAFGYFPKFAAHCRRSNEPRGSQFVHHVSKIRRLHRGSRATADRRFQIVEQLMKAARQLCDVIRCQLAFHCACTAPAASLAFAKQKHRAINSGAVRRSQSPDLLDRGHRG